MKCLKISNQRRIFYINASGVSEYDLFVLWINLSKIGYYKLFDKFVIVDSSKCPINTFFDSLESFKKFLGV